MTRGPVWPSGHTTEELEEVYLTDQERVRLAALIRMGVSLAPHYRDRLRMRRMSWLGIPRAEQTPARMARVLVLLDRPRIEARHGWVFEAPCVPQIGQCHLYGPHCHMYSLTLI